MGNKNWGVLLFALLSCLLPQPFCSETGHIKNMHYRMKIIASISCFLFAVLVVTACHDEPFNIAHRYKHDLVSGADCQKRQQQNAEFSCYEWVDFGSNGQVSILLGGGDIIVSSTYTRSKNEIIINSSLSLPRPIKFKIPNDTELIRVDDGTRWLSY
jgi:hypothetical protein